MKLKNSAFEELNQMEGIRLLRVSRRLKPKVNIRLYRFFKKIDEEATSYFEVKGAILKKYQDGIDDETKLPKWKNDKAEKKAIKEITELMDVEFEINNQKIFDLAPRLVPEGTLNSVEMGRLEELGIMNFDD